MRDFLFIVGSESGNQVRQRLDNFKQLPPPATISLDDSVDWKELSQSTDLTSLTASIPPAAMDNYNVWLQWRQKQKVQLLTVLNVMECLMRKCLYFTVINNVYFCHLILQYFY